MPESMDAGNLIHMSKPPIEPDPIFDLAKKRVRKLARLLSANLGPEDQHSGEQVHALRLCCKRLRALVQLYRPCCSRRAIRSVEKRIKQVADRFAERRDADVQYRMLCRTIDEFDRNHQDALQELLSSYFKKKQESARAGDARISHKGLEPVLESWKRNLSSQAGFDLEQGLANTWKRSRQLACEAMLSDADPAYHRCRKWVKFHLYQLKMLDLPDRIPDEAYLEKLTRLGESLGDLHDRCVLEQSLIERGDFALDGGAGECGRIGSGELRALVLQWLDEKKRRDKARCLDLFRGVFPAERKAWKL